MKKEFEDCLKRHKITEYPRGKILVQKELNIAEADLGKSRKNYTEQDYKWATIQAYYSMFHASRALLYNKGYREKSHYCLNIALRVLYVETKKLPVNYIDALSHGKILREDADYYDQWNSVSASGLIDTAAKYLDKAKEIIIEDSK